MFPLLDLPTGAFSKKKKRQRPQAPDHWRLAGVGPDFEVDAAAYMVEVLKFEGKPLDNASGLFLNEEKMEQFFFETSTNWFSPLYRNGPWELVHGEQPAYYNSSTWSGNYERDAREQLRLDIDLCLSGLGAAVLAISDRGEKVLDVLRSAKPDEAEFAAINARIADLYRGEPGDRRPIGRDQFWGPRRLLMFLEVLTGRVTTFTNSETMVDEMQAACGFRKPSMIIQGVDDGVGQISKEPNQLLPAELIERTGTCTRMDRENGSVFRALYAENRSHCCAASRGSSAKFRIGRTEARETFMLEDGTFSYGTGEVHEEDQSDLLTVPERLTLVHVGDMPMSVADTQALPEVGATIHAPGLVWTSSSPRWMWKSDQEKVLYVLTIPKGVFRAALQSPNQYTDLSLLEAVAADNSAVHVKTAVLPVVVLAPNASWRVTSVDKMGGGVRVCAKHDTN
jgi:hypothetical protein